MNCLNTYGSCQNEAKPIEYRIGTSFKVTHNFCSDECRRKYNGSVKFKRMKKPKSHFHHPSKKEWIVKFNKSVFIYDPWEKKYWRYKEGYGLCNDLDTLIATEDSDYYKKLIQIAENIKSKSIPDRPTKSAKMKLIPRPINRKIKIPKGFHQCNICGQMIHIIGNPTNCLLCPNCNNNIFREKYYHEFHPSELPDRI